MTINKKQSNAATRVKNSMKKQTVKEEIVPVQSEKKIVKRKRTTVKRPSPSPSTQTVTSAIKNHNGLKRTARVAVVSGLRTPFAKQLTQFKNLNAIELGKMVVAELLQGAALDVREVEQIVFGNVLAMPEAPNIAREIVLGSRMRVSTDAYSVSRACATSYQSVASIADSIRLGRIQVGIAGGADSSSVVPIQVSRRLSAMLVKLSKVRTLAEKVKILTKLRLKDLSPVPPAVKEYSTGLTMGMNAEQMARDHFISRSDQDDLAHRSHLLASKAWNEGLLDNEVMTTYIPPYKDYLKKDNNIRFDSQRDAYDKLRPAFDKKYGTITAANSTPLTDGASAVLMMSEDKAKVLGYEPLGYISSYAFAAIDATHDMLMGPSYATPMVLDAMKMTLKDIDLIDMHEAFAAQTLCNINAFSSTEFAKNKLHRTRAIGNIDMQKFNILGGSLAYGHPFAATGTRQITQLLNALKRQGGGVGLATACAAGGLGAAMILEVD